jgi:hypothetical protein
MWCSAFREVDCRAFRAFRINLELFLFAWIELVFMMKVGDFPVDRGLDLRVGSATGRGQYIHTIA